MRGADIFSPGVLSMSFNIKENDTVSVYADMEGKCLKGSDANSYVQSNKVRFLANGIACISRTDVFKNLINT